MELELVPNHFVVNHLMIYDDIQYENSISVIDQIQLWSINLHGYSQFENLGTIGLLRLIGPCPDENQN